MKIIKVFGSLLIIILLFFGFYLVFKFNQPNVVTSYPSHSTQTKFSPFKGWMDYTNTLDAYSFYYPNKWIVTQEKRQGYDSPWIRISPPTTPCPTGMNPFKCQTAEVIFIYSENNSKDSSIQSFLGTNHSTIKPFKISGLEGIRTVVSGEFEEDTVLVKKGLRIYTISLVESGADVKIPTDTYDKILASFHFTN